MAFHTSARGSPCGLGPFVPIAGSLSSLIPLHEYFALTTYLGTKCRRFASRNGTQRAAVMVAHRILEAAYFIIRDTVPYRELGEQYLDAHHREHLIRHHVRRLESLGLTVAIRELPLTA